MAIKKRNLGGLAALCEAILVLAVLLAALAVAGFSLGACSQPGGVDISTPGGGVGVGGPVTPTPLGPRTIPVGNWNEADGVLAQFTIAWTDEVTAGVDSNKDGVVSDNELRWVLSLVRGKWDTYVEFMDSRPYVLINNNPLGLTNKLYRNYFKAVPQNGRYVLDNPSDIKVVLKRWWPKDDGYGPLTRFKWTTYHSVRYEAFQKERDRLQGIIDALKESPYYERQFNTGTGMVLSPLKETVLGNPGGVQKYTGIEDFIALPDPFVQKQENFSYLKDDVIIQQTTGQGKRGELARGAGKGFLHDLYLGYVPLESEYFHSGGGVWMAYPEN